jgi:putative peptidoglycan lipid II flippase
MKENSLIIKAAGVVGAATLLSRILGYIRDAVIAWYFGAGHSSDAFIAAAFIPVLTDYLTEDGPDESLRLARSALFVMSILLVVLSIFGILLAPLIVKVIAPGFFDSPGKIPLTIALTRIMFPYIFFIGLVALCMGILNVFGHFAAPALAPVLLNLAMICSVIFICPYLSNPVMGLWTSATLYDSKRTPPATKRQTFASRIKKNWRAHASHNFWRGRLSD